MLMTFCRVMALCIVLTACAHRGAARVECDGPLRPINANVHAEPPVSVAPATSAVPSSDEKQP